MSNIENSAPLLKISIKREGSDESGKETFSIVPENFNLPESSLASDTPVQSESSRSPNTVFTHGQYVKCGVPRCNNYFDGQRQEFIGISYFPFPEEPELRNQWIKAIDLPEDTDTQPLMICSQHFGNNDIYNMKEPDGKTTAHLKPNAYPCKKLYAFVQNHNQQAYASGKFIGFENPLMDTTQDVSEAHRKSELLTTDKDAIPKITSVLSTNAMGRLVDSSGKTKPKHQKRVVKHSENICEDELIGEETVSSSEDPDMPTCPNNPEKGLKVIPALVKLPPRLPKVDLVGDSVNFEAIASVGPITTSRLPNVDLSIEKDVAKEETPLIELSGEFSTSSIPGTLSPDHVPIKRRRGRRTKEEIRKQEEDDDWEPSFWGKKALKKDGFAGHLDADRKRKDNETRNKTTQPSDITDFSSRSNEVEKSQEDGLEEEDEGWRVVEPIATGDKKSDEEDDSNNPLALLEVSMAEGENEGNEVVPSAVKRRPGPASKTCRPRYIPPTTNIEANDLEEAGKDESKENGVDESQQNLSSDDTCAYDDSLLVDWSFFKSLLPDLGKLSHEKRIELKSFVLDTLNSAIYDGKPITPILNL
ncbi:hypothetical protein GE061_017896 [Apolygus lucorum]|uniref:THAP-type domain-containing protein n=1 Tax=Apolygus lucorum TaxID=248454 RepID=A0A8S9XC66_APOLU|nr:hypothetical protein GE061_017896 [Apolygus lucorum]